MSEEAILLVITNDQDEDGFPVETIKKIPVFVQERSVRYTEFYDALKAGYNPKIVLEMRIEDWEMSRKVADGKVSYASRVIYDEEELHVIRTFKKDKAKIQVTCGEREVRV